jgi:hypothetical protein
VFRVRADRFDDKVEFVGAVDFASYTVGHIGPDELGFGEVIEPVDPLGIPCSAEDKLRMLERRDSQDCNAIGLERFWPPLTKFS